MLSQLELLQIRMEALFTYDGPYMLRVNEPWQQTSPAPLLHAGRTLQGEIRCCFSRQADPSAVAKAQELLARGVWEAEAYAALFGTERCQQEVCYSYPRLDVPGSRCRALSLSDKPALAAAFGDCAQELATASPYMGCEQDGSIVSICRSVRKGRGHEAGIETLPAYRRQGHALEALRGWTAAVLALDAVPLYSANRNNLPSQRLAEKCGYIPYAHTLEVWQA